MYNKHNPLDEAHVRMVMKALGHFHGRWIKYKFMSQAGQVKIYFLRNLGLKGKSLPNTKYVFENCPDPLVEKR